MPYPRMLKITTLVLLLIDGSEPLASADELWPGWLGPGRNGWVGHFQPPKTWPGELKKGWEVKVGTGYGSPLVAKGRVYQHARQGEEEVVWCMDLKSGDVKWKKTIATPFKIAGGGQYHGKGPKSCPVLSDGRLFTLSITGMVVAWDAITGKRLWIYDTSSRFKGTHPRWGASTSPIVDGNRLIAHLGTDFQGALIALDTASGNKIWEQGKDGPSYSSPLLAEIQGVRQIIDWNERAIVGVESKTGKKLWEHPAKGDFMDQNMPTPVFHDGRIYLGAENRGIRCLKPSMANGKWQVRELWHQKSVALNMSSAIMNDNLLYGFSHYGRGRFFCLDPKTGTVLWQGPERTGQHATFLAIPGYVIALLNSGELQIIQTSRKQYKKVASYKVSKTATWAPPVLLKNGLLVKDKETLALWEIPRKK